METPVAGAYQSIIAANDADTLVRDIRRHVVSSLGADPTHASRFRVYRGLARAVRDRLVDAWITTQRSYYDAEVKRVYYLSLEFLPGRFLRNALVNLCLADAARVAVERLGFTLDEIEEQEWDPGLGNGGLGRLASCYLASMASLGLPGYGYGIRYDYGIFYQLIENGWQVERPDHWLRFGDPWSIARPEHLFPVRTYGRVEQRREADGWEHFDWVDTTKVMAAAFDILIPGYRNGNAVNMRLWSARSSREVDLDYYHRGDYVGAVQSKVESENISRVLYPSEAVREGKELRLRQEYFFVCATFQDIMRRFKKKHRSFELLPERVAVQLNDTHPAIAVAELMRLLVDEERLRWECAWELTRRTFSYTNHTVLPEALECWSAELLGRVLPRHLQIIQEIDRRSAAALVLRCPGDDQRRRRMALIGDGPDPYVRMANLAVVGSHTVNGVSALHSRILAGQLFRDFAELDPDAFTNCTNGVDHRRFLLQANPSLAQLISEAVGDGWVRDPSRLAALAPAADDAAFRADWRRVRRLNKERLAAHLRATLGFALDPDALLDIQVKRIHEYKRQLMNLLHVIHLLDRARSGADWAGPHRVVLIGGKAAPSYWLAKLIIKLATAVGKAVAAEPAAAGRLSFAFLPNYGVSTAERLIPACDLSEQISTAGMEASGTGNMKFAMNGARIIGTLDGANIEIMEAVGADNLFVFGLDADQVVARRASGWDARSAAAADPDLGRILAELAGGRFSPDQPELFRPLVDALLGHDHFMVVADFRAYLECQERVAAAYLDQDDWTRRSILTVAGSGAFSSDRAVADYAARIWQVRPLLPTS